MDSCLDIDEIVASVAREIESRRKFSPEESCPQSWLMPSGQTIITDPEEPDHFRIMPKTVRAKVSKALPDISIEDFVSWIMFFYFNAIRLAMNSVEAMDGKMMTRKQAESLETIFLIMAPERNIFEGFYVDVVGQRMPMPGKKWGLSLEIVESAKLEGSDEAVFDDLKKILERHGIYPF